MRTASEESLVPAPSRPVPDTRLPRTLVLTAVAGLAVAITLGMYWQPRESVVLVLLAVPPLLSVVALAVLAAVVHTLSDQRLRWFTAGLAVAVGLMLLQLIASNLLSVGGGPLETSATAQTALNPAFHLCIALGAVLGAVRAPTRLVVPAVVAGLTAGLAIALDLVPLPALLDGATFTPALRIATGTVTTVTLAALLMWSRSIGRRPPGPQAWVAAALLLSAIDEAALTLASGYLSWWWWASLVLRVGTYAVLAAGCLGWLMQLLVVGERWTDHELARREVRLRSADRLNRRLLHVADRLSGALSPALVSAAAVELSRESVGAQAACLLPVGRRDGHGVALGAGSDDVEWAARLVGELTRAGDLTSPVVSDAHAERTPADESPWAYAVVPVRSDGELWSHLVVLDSPGRIWTEQDVTFLVGLVDQCALALSRSNAYERVEAASSTLLASLRPERHEAVAGVRLHSAYRAVTTGHEVGGDWFDSIEVDEDRAVLVIGDVMGKGWRATAVMGQMRTALRAAAALGLDPAAALATLDGSVVALEDDEIVTVLYVTIDRAAGRLGIARAGHPPPLLLAHDGTTRYVERGGSPPIGIGGARQEVWLPLQDVAALVLYTDGIVERRASDVDVGMQRFAEQVERVACEARTLGDELAWDVWLEQIRRRTDWQDDVAVMVACLAPVPAPGALPTPRACTSGRHDAGSTSGPPADLGRTPMEYVADG